MLEEGTLVHHRLVLGMSTGNIQQAHSKILFKTRSCRPTLMSERAQDNVEFPSSLQNLCFGFDFDQSLERVPLVSAARETF